MADNNWQPLEAKTAYLNGKSAEEKADILERASRQGPGPQDADWVVAKACDDAAKRIEVATAKIEAAAPPTEKAFEGCRSENVRPTCTSVGQHRMADSQKPATSGIVPAYLRRQFFTPWTALAGVGIIGLATASLWAPHPKPPDLAGMAARTAASMQSSAASADTGKPEAPDPSPTPFAHHSVAPQTIAQVIHPQATPPPAAVTQNVAVAQAAAVSVPPVPTAAPTPPASTAGDFGEPDDQEAHGPPSPSVSPPRTGGVGYVPAVSRYELQEGSVIHCRWSVHVDSEQVGHVSGEVIEAVDSSTDSQVEIIPVGATVQGWYATANTGTTRLIVDWHRIEFPNGRKFEMGEQPAWKRAR